MGYQSVAITLLWGDAAVASAIGYGLGLRIGPGSRPGVDEWFKRVSFRNLAGNNGGAQNVRSRG